MDKLNEVKLGKYRHFKGQEYEAIAVARDCNNPETWLVIYRALYNHPKFGDRQVWSRELSDFLGEKVFEEDTIVGGKLFKAGEKVRRFEFVK